MVFCTDLDFILTLFCMKVTSLAFWRELDLIIHHPLLLVLQQSLQPQDEQQLQVQYKPFLPALDQGVCGGQQFMPSGLQAHLKNLSVRTFLYPWSEVKYMYDDFQLPSVW